MSGESRLYPHLETVVSVVEEDIPREVDQVVMVNEGNLRSAEEGILTSTVTGAVFPVRVIRVAPSSFRERLGERCAGWRVIFCERNVVFAMLWTAFGMCVGFLLAVLAYKMTTC